MEPVCVRHTEFPHASKLFTDFLYHFNRVAPFYGGSPASPASYQRAAQQLHFPDGRRAALVSALSEINGDHSALEKLSRPGTVAVVTGQQVGLFSGPCYTIYKALTAIKLARTLSSQGLSAVAVFWLATEDHDFQEVNHCWGFDAAQKPVLLPMEAGETDHVPVGTIRLENPPLQELRSSLSGLPYGDEIAAMVEVSYASGRTMGAAFLDLLKRILPDCLLYIDPLHPAVRSLAAPLLREALASAPDLQGGLLERKKELESAGYHSQVHIDENSSLFFLLEKGRRIPLRPRGGEYQYREATYSEAALADRAGALSPNALLRPVVQDYILPTVAYIGGPAEVAYMAQSQVLYNRLLGRMPVTVPRAGFTVLDRRAAKLMDRYGVRMEDFFHGLEAIEAKFGSRLVPPDMEEAILSASESIADHISELQEKLELFDPTLAEALDRSRAKIMHQMSRIERKAAREAMRREGRAEADAEYLFNLVYPHKHFQERFYTILPFLARHGLDFVDRLYENIRLDCPDHILFTAA